MKKGITTTLKESCFTSVISGVLLLFFLVLTVFPDLAYSTIRSLGLSTGGAARGDFYRLITYAFLHVRCFNLFMNLIFIGILGFLLEPRIGSIRIAFAFAIGAITAASLPVVWTMMSGEGQIHIGSTAAVYSLFGAYCITILRNLKCISTWERTTGLILGILIVLNLAFPTMTHATGSLVNIAAIAVGIAIGFSKRCDNKEKEALCRLEVIT